MNILSITKAVVGWVAAIASVVCLFVAMPYAMPLGVIAIGFNTLPTSA